MTAADTLRQAATLLRTLGMGAPANNQPWRYAKGIPSDSVRTATGWEVAYGDAPGDLRYIATMHPGVGLALADLLEAEAIRYDRAASVGEFDASHDRPLVVARQLLGTGEQPVLVNPCTQGASVCGQHGYDCPAATEEATR